MKKQFLLLLILALITFLTECGSKQYENFQELNSASRLWTITKRLVSW